MLKWTLEKYGKRGRDWRARKGSREADTMNMERATQMTGIQFITDSKGRKTAAVIDLKKHRALWEDIEDVLVSRSRRHEKRVPLEKVKASLIASGKLRG
jgi:hypothetical protein